MSINHRYDFVYLFDVKDGNPNGDPDAGNMPRVDPETGQGLTTDVCLKRKIRNFIGLTQTREGMDIYVKDKAVLNPLHEEAFRAVAPNEPIVDRNGDSYTMEEALHLKKAGKSKEKDKGEILLAPHRDKARNWLCQRYYDVRTFGAVMSTGVNAGQVRGPIQLTFSRSIDPIFAQEHSITVSAARKEDESVESQIGIQGRKATVPYGLYRCHGFISAHLAAQTGFDDNDLEFFWQALTNMFDHDRSAARGEMTARGLYVFKHDSKLGNAQAHDLFERVNAALKDDSIVAPRSFADYQVTVDQQELPIGVTLDKRIG